jgi:hypothetical protein
VLLGPQMRLEYSLEAQRLLPYCCQEWSEALRRNSKFYWHCHSLRRASSLSLAMGLTTILTIICLCPPKYAHVQNPYF